MNLFFYIIEPLIYIGAIYCILYKRELAILYLPAIFFAQDIIASSLPAVLGYGLISFYIGFLIYLNPLFFKNNIFALFLFLFHLFLIPGSSDLVAIRPALFAVMWTFLLIPLAMAILEKYPRKVIFKELSNSAFIILGLFVTNVIFSTLFNYSPHEMYGMQSGILYGELVDTDFNILAVAIFIALFFLMYKMNPWYLLLTLTSLSVIALSMRRSVMGACLMALAFIWLILLVRGRLQQVFLTFGVVVLTGLTVVLFTEFSALFQERFEQRNLANRELAGEARFAEYLILYKDAFVHYDFNPWIGYELLNSSGNYGKGAFGIRSLHADITNIIHSAGLLGLMLYLLMVGKAFWESIKHSQTPTDRLIILFCCCIFIVFTITGRYTQTGYMLLLFLLLLLPLGTAQQEFHSSAKEEAFPSLLNLNT